MSIRSLAVSYTTTHPAIYHSTKAYSIEPLLLRGAMTRKAMFTVGKKKSIVRGVAPAPASASSQMSRRPPCFQHMALRRLRELKKIVPDAQDADVDVLLRRTAEYICVLELKVTVLRRLSAVYGL